MTRVREKIEMTKENLNTFFEYINGELFWKQPTGSAVKVGSKVNGIYRSGDNYYSTVRLKGITYPTHRIVWIMHSGDIPTGYMVDHIDGDGLNNRIDNLRLALSAQNTSNSRKRPNTSSQYKGVHFNKATDKWFASISVDGKKFHLGSYDAELDAHLSYCDAAEAAFGEFFNSGE